MAFSKPFPNTEIERLENKVLGIVERAKTEKGGYVAGLAPYARSVMVTEYAQAGLIKIWGLQHQYRLYKEADEHEKSLEQQVQTEPALDMDVTPSLGLSEL